MAKKPCCPSESTGQDLPITDRQREVLRLLAEGWGTGEIAWKLGISAKTVETHRARLQERLGVASLAGLVRYAIRVGLIRA